MKNKEWFFNIKQFQDHIPSVAEKRISKILEEMCIHYYREVSFYGCKNLRGTYFCFDFLLPAQKVVIEYDGEEFHQSEKAIINDTLKTNFIRKTSYKLVRLNKTHWGDLRQILKDIIEKNKPKRPKKKQQLPQQPKSQKDPSTQAFSRPKKRVKPGSKEYYRRVKVTIEDLMPK